MTERASDFGRLYAELLGEPPAKGTAAERARLLLRHRELGFRRRSLHRRPRFLVPLAASLAGALVAGAVWFAAPSTEWRASSGGHLVVVGASLTPAANEALTVDFTDGSQISLEPHAEVTLRGLDETRTDLLLHEGRLSARVHPREGASFRVAAGPYEVRVTGTAFTVEWDRSAGFRVAVAEGSVEIVGGDLPPSGVRIAAGEEFSRRDSSGLDSSERPSSRTEEVDAERAREPAPAPLPLRVSDLPRVVEMDERAAVSSRAKPSLESSPSELAEHLEPSPPPKSEWLRFAKAAEYGRAVSSAEAVGFGELVETSAASELLLLANAARYSRNAERAKQAYSGIRRRFPGSNSARLSAYYLARLSGDLERQPRSEAKWLETYLAEAPRGELAASARARLIELLRGSGDAAGARSIARDYLRYHPSGPHAEGARVLLEDSTNR